MLAGVPCVVSSLWSVQDLSTALLMERFYRNHLSGEMDFAVALQEAQLWVRREVTVKQVRDYLARAVNKGYVKMHQALAYRREYDNLLDDALPFESPYYWAAFAVYGA
jgi:CHAT domain-containing protein